mgnify:CR=1 FL=1
MQTCILWVFLECLKYRIRALSGWNENLSVVCLICFSFFRCFDSSDYIFGDINVNGQLVISPLGSFQVFESRFNHGTILLFIRGTLRSVGRSSWRACVLWQNIRHLFVRWVVVSSIEKQIFIIIQIIFFVTEHLGSPLCFLCSQIAHGPTCLS